MSFSLLTPLFMAELQNGGNIPDLKVDADQSLQREALSSISPVKSEAKEA